MAVVQTEGPRSIADVLVASADDSGDGTRKRHVRAGLLPIGFAPRY
jgi:hypothetical protein